MSLLNLHGTAVRHNSQIEVNLFGQVNDSCHTASIASASSATSGIARVDIKTGVKPGSHFCLMVVLPWAETTNIADNKDNEVEVFVDGKSQLKLPVKDEPAQFEVYRNLNGGGCIIVPAGTPVLAIYSHAFGPASRAGCEQFVSENCGLAPN